RGCSGKVGCSFHEGLRVRAVLDLSAGHVCRSPRGGERMVAEARTDTAAEPGRAYSILITDDDRGSRETLAGLLDGRGFQTREASCGEEAIEIVRVELIHLAIFDMHMPRMTGLEALEQVRLLNDLLPAILVTADATRDLIRQALQAHVYS